jgi:hypothetical protein
MGSPSILDPPLSIAVGYLDCNYLFILQVATKSNDSSRRDPPESYSQLARRDS